MSLYSKRTIIRYSCHLLSCTDSSVSNNDWMAFLDIFLKGCIPKGGSVCFHRLEKASDQSSPAAAAPAASVIRSRTLSRPSSCIIDVQVFQK